jgi:phosphoribosylformimino-5-aminoimidazole carboxamide ribotide isomerase
MRILPVIDLKGGLVVRGIAGRRAEYRPVVSRLTDSAEPLRVAAAFRRHFQWSELYLADLDAIAGAAPAVAVYDALRAAGFHLWVDAGLKDASDAAALSRAVDGVVAGLETLAGPAALGAMCRALGSERVVFSLDLKAGQPLGDLGRWRRPEPLALAEEAIEQGIRHLLVLDLARVGLAGGVGSEAVCAELSRRYPLVSVWTGGGIRDAADLRRLAASGVSTILVASALHDGLITAADLASGDSA